jgi:hypothetical protein
MAQGSFLLLDRYWISSIDYLRPTPLFFLRHLNGAHGNALEVTTRLGNQRDCLFGREALSVSFTRRPDHRDKDAGVGDTVHWAPTGAFNGAYSTAATAIVHRKSTCGVATGGPRLGFYRATEPGTELTVAHGAVGLEGIIVLASEVYQVRFIETAPKAAKATRVTLDLKAAEHVSVDTSHGEEEGSENDGKLDHHGSGTFFVKLFDFCD